MNPIPEADHPIIPGGPRQERSTSLVLISGLATTSLTLLGVYLLEKNTDDFHIMGWYANYVLPVGALIVGVAASSGYGLASWFSGIKITRKLLWTVVVLQFLAYFAAQYIEFKGLHLFYRTTGEPVSFFKYYDIGARSFAWKQNDGSSGEPLGVWGYCFRALEVVGFVLGGLIVPLVLCKAPYCPQCQLYMKTRLLGLVPASVPVRKVKKSDVVGQSAYESEHQQALDLGKKTVETFQQLATGNNMAEFRKELDKLEPGKKANAKLPIRFSLQLVHCKHCFSGQLVTKLLLGQGQNLKQSDFARAEMHSESVRSVAQ